MKIKLAELSHGHDEEEAGIKDDIYVYRWMGWAFTERKKP